MKKNTKQVNMRLNADLVDKLDEIARERHTDRTALINKAILNEYNIDESNLRDYVDDEAS
jgi:predicted transcriptional regulator